MKKLFIIANWKSNETTAESIAWFKEISNYKFPLSNDKEIVICPPFTVLISAKEIIDNSKLPIKLGAQNISPFGEGPHTGEINAREIKDLAEYVIIGHSERRREFGEDNQMLDNKVQQALENKLIPIFCVQGVETYVPDGVTLVAFEPISAIGTGQADTPEDAENVAKIIKEKNKVQYVLYGGSVTGENVNSFTQMPSIDGVLVGGASLDADKFIQIIENS